MGDSTISHITTREDADMVEKASIFNRDDALLAELGYKAELKRNFSVLQVFGVAFSIMSLLPSIASSINFSLAAGPIGMTWGWLVASVCILTVGISMSEMGSAMPTSGGLYWWTYKFAPESVNKPFCFLAGYSNTLGLIGALCSIDYGFAVLLLSVVSIASDGSYVANKYQIYGVFIAAVASHALVGSLATRIIAKLQTICIIANLIVIVITVIALPIGKANTPEGLNSAKFVFTQAENTTGWPTAWAFFLAWLSPIWTIGAFDSCVHMAEEAANASIAVPFGILGSISLCGILGFLIMSILAATMDQDVTRVLHTPSGQPMAQIYMDALGKNWTVGMMSMLFIIQWFMGLSIIVAGSRQAWAFSRDGALPFSSIIRVVNYRLGVPLRALWFMCIAGSVMGLLSLINSVAANALFSLTLASNSLAWLLPIASRAFYKPEGFKPGPFYIGGITSRCISIFASFFLFFVIFVLAVWPVQGPNPHPDEMNYTVVINGFVWIGCLAYYFLSARKWFEGPKSTFEAYDIDAIVARDAEEMGVSEAVFDDYGMNYGMKTL